MNCARTCWNLKREDDDVVGIEGRKDGGEEVEQNWWEFIQRTRC